MVSRSYRVVEVMVKKAVDTYGWLDYAFNNEGIEGVVKPTVEYEPTGTGRSVEDI